MSVWGTYAWAKARQRSQAEKHSASNSRGSSQNEPRGRTLYILDEPTTGLHFHDIRQLLTVLHRLRDQGNTVVVIEHNLDVIKTAGLDYRSWPRGQRGGRLVGMGTPEEISMINTSYTGQFLKGILTA